MLDSSEGNGKTTDGVSGNESIRTFSSRESNKSISPPISASQSSQKYFKSAAQRHSFSSPHCSMCRMVYVTLY